MSKLEFSPGPWVRRDTEDYAEIDSSTLANLAMVSTEANATLIAAAPAMDLILSLIRHGVARIESFELCFNGMRYSHNDDWNRVLSVIGWDVARAALSRARGSEGA